MFFNQKPRIIARFTYSYLGFGLKGTANQFVCIAVLKIYSMM